MSTWNKPALLQLREMELGESFEAIARRMTQSGCSDDEIAHYLRVSRQTYRNYRDAAGLKPQRELVAASSAS